MDTRIQDKIFLKILHFDDMKMIFLVLTPTSNAEWTVADSILDVISATSAERSEASSEEMFWSWFRAEDLLVADVDLLVADAFLVVDPLLTEAINILLVSTEDSTFSNSLWVSAFILSLDTVLLLTRGDFLASSWLAFIKLAVAAIADSCLFSEEEVILFAIIDDEDSFREDEVMEEETAACIWLSWREEVAKDEVDADCISWREDEPKVEDEAAWISWRDVDVADCISCWEDASIVDDDNAAKEDEEKEAACTWLSFLEEAVKEEAEEAEACIWLSFRDDASKEDEDEAIFVEDAA